MTDNDIVNVVAADPAVVAANTTFDAEGAPHPPAAADLTARARTTLQAVVMQMMRKGRVRKALLTRSTSITLSGTTYTFGLTVGEILAISRGTDGAVLTHWKDRSAYRVWYADYVGTGSTTEMQGWYQSGSSDDGALIITFAPGVGSESTCTVDYIRTLPGPPYSVSIVRSDLHDVPLLGTLNRMSGGRYEQEWQQALDDLDKILEPGKGGISRMRKDGRVRDMIWRHNSRVAGPSGTASPFYVSRQSGT